MNLAELNSPGGGATFSLTASTRTKLLINKLVFLECGLDAHCVTSFVKPPVNGLLAQPADNKRRESLLSGRVSDPFRGDDRRFERRGSDSPRANLKYVTRPTYITYVW